MALINLPEAKRQISEPKDVAAFLATYGIFYERWPVEGRLDADATSEQILAAYAPEVEAVQRKGGYVTADVINVNPQTPNLDVMLDRFNKEHTHADDEVRFIVKGRGLFHVHPTNGDPVFSIEVGPGDLINVPAGTQHWFDLCGDRTIRAIRLFKDPAGWSPQYVPNSAHVRFDPVCWGPAYVPSSAAERFQSTVNPLAKK